MRRWRVGRGSGGLLEIERWLLPDRCLSCEAAVATPEAPLVCTLCRQRWRPLPSPTCARCGAPGVGECRLCHEWPRDLRSVQSAVALDDATRQLIHHFKYHGWRRLAIALAGAMLPLLRRIPPAPLVPIPVTSRRRRRRGYNQAAELARALGCLAGYPVWGEMLERTRETPSQTRLAAAERAANLDGAFRARRAARSVILVDDVFTTGATLVSASAAILEAGTSEVAAVTFARAEPPLAALAHHLTTDSSTSERD